MTKKHLLTVLSAGMITAQQKPLTTNAGTPVGDNQNSKCAGEEGPVLLEDIHLIEKLASFDRERTPERVVHEWNRGDGTDVCSHDSALHVVQLLRKYSADVDASDERGLTARKSAEQQGKDELVKVLEKHRSNSPSLR